MDGAREPRSYSRLTAQVTDQLPLIRMEAVTARLFLSIDCKSVGSKFRHWDHKKTGAAVAARALSSVSGELNVNQGPSGVRPSLERALLYIDRHDG